MTGELSFEENILLENSKEHLKVILGNIRVANEQLGEALKGVSEAREELKKISAKISEKGAVLSNLVGEAEMIKMECSTIAHRIGKRETELLGREKQFEEFSSKKTNEIEDKKKEAETEQLRIKEETKRLYGTLETVGEEVRVLSKRRDEIIESKRLLEKEKTILTEEVAEIKKTLGKVESDFRKKKLLVEGEINVLTLKNSLEGGKIKLVREALEKREAALSVRENNFLIRYERLKRYINEYFPGQNLNL